MNNKCIERLIRFDSIRLFKLFEIFYYTIISFIFTIIFIISTEKLSFNFKIYENEKKDGVDNITLIKEILFDLLILVLFIYYLKKILGCIPFIFAPLNKKYKPSIKGEIYIGIGLGSAAPLYSSLYFSIKNKMEILNERIKKDIISII
tara:strand:+ start:44 stop:487 length:444 start_codon:yes stop_codon:yes gene_type:complete